MMEKDNYMQIRVQNRVLPVRKQDVQKVLLNPLITHIPFGNPLIYGILYDGQEMIPLLDFSEGSSVNRDFGRLCILLERGGRKLAAVISEITDEEVQEEENWNEKDIFRLFFQEVHGPNEKPEGYN